MLPKTLYERAIEVEERYSAQGKELLPVQISESLMQSFQAAYGNGTHRGGNGVIRRIQFREAMTAAILSGHRLIPPFGLQGGAPGAIGRNAVQRQDGSIELLPSKAEIQMHPGDTFIIETPAGRGFGRSNREQ